MSPIFVCDNDHQPGEGIKTLAIAEAGDDDIVKSIDLCQVCRLALLSGDWTVLAERKVEVAAPAPRRGRPPGPRQPRTPRAVQQQADADAQAEQQRQWREAATKPDDEEVA